MDRFIKADLYRYVPKQYSLKCLIKGLREPGFRFLFVFRMAGKYKKWSIGGLFFRVLHRRMSYKFGYQIPVVTNIGKGFYIGHFGAVVISPVAILGKNCNIAHGVTVGRIGAGNRKGAPIIGDYVWMGTNAVIVGGIVVGSNVLIAPGSFVNFDVPDNSVVIGNPAKIIAKNDPTKNYISNILSE